MTNYKRLNKTGCNPFIQVLSEKFNNPQSLFVFGRFRCNPFIQVLSEKFGSQYNLAVALKGCNPFIQVLSEKSYIRQGLFPLVWTVVIPLFRSYRKNLNFESRNLLSDEEVVIPLFRSYRKNLARIMIWIISRIVVIPLFRSYRKNERKWVRQ